MIKFSKLNMCRHCLIVSCNALLLVFGIPSLTDSLSHIFWTLVCIIMFVNCYSKYDYIFKCQWSELPIS